MSRGQIWCATLLSEAREVAEQTVSTTSFAKAGESKNGIVNLVEEVISTDEAGAQEAINLLDEEVGRMVRALNKVRRNCRKASEYLHGKDVEKSCVRCGERR